MQDQENQGIVSRYTQGLRTSNSKYLSASGGLTPRLRKRALYGWELFCVRTTILLSFSIKITN